MERIVQFKINPVLSLVEGYKLIIGYIFFSDYNKNYVLTILFPFPVRAALRTNGDKKLITLVPTFRQVQDKLFRIGRIY